MRISRQHMFIEMAHTVSKRATCFRLNVGALLVVRNRIVGMGYNGQEPGEEHCKSMCEPGECNTTHAEINCLKHAHFTKEVGDLYCTDSPCQKCATYIVDSGLVGRVFYDRPYRDHLPLHFLEDHQVEVYRVLHAGIVDIDGNQVCL